MRQWFLHGMLKVALVAGAVIALSTAEARQMLYCYDFEVVGANQEIYTAGLNKGTGLLDLVDKRGHVKCQNGGALGSAYALLEEHAKSALWLGDGNSALCSGLSGFTMSFWVNAPTTTTAWWDFFGFRFGGLDIRFEYVNKNRDFTTFYNDAKGAYYCCYQPDTDVLRDVTGVLQANVWTHFCLVWNFNTCAIDIYVGGVLRGSIKANWSCGNTLSQVCIGCFVRSNGQDRPAGAAQTGIDDFALFDFSATSEQVQWLLHHPPALPPEGPGRDMPYRFSFDRADNPANGVYLESYGSAQGAVSQLGEYYRQWVEEGAFETGHAFNLLADYFPNSVYVADSGPRGLGATIGSGFTFSIWVKGGNPAVAWSDFFGFSIGNQHYRGEWMSTSAPTFTGYGNGTPTGSVTLTPDVWNNICYVWNDALKRIDVYLNGESTSAYWTYTTTPTATDALSQLEIGSVVMGENGAWRNMNPCGMPVDEAALFNYSFTPDEIAELMKAKPMLPPFTATNLVRTVDTSGVWQGFMALWTVNNATAQRLMWPAWEDLRVDASVTITDADLTLTNDTFVTCHSLAFANGTDAATVRLTVPNVTGAIFKPQALALGDGVELVLPLGDSCSGAVTLGANAKLVFDAAGYTGAAAAFTAEGGFELPGGETDVLAHATILNGAELELALSTDGKQILIQPIATVPATAVWIGAAGGDLSTAANWTCRNAAGDTLTDATPTACTVIQVLGATSLSVSPTDTFAFACVELTGNVTLTADCDWRGLGAISVPNGVTVDVNGHTLTVGEAWSDWTPVTVTTGVAEGVLDFEVATNKTVTLIGAVQLTGELKVVKSGEGTLVLAAAGQSYTGGTEVNEGTLVYGTSSNPAGPQNASVKVAAGATLDMNGMLNPSSCVYNYDLAGTVRQILQGNGGWSEAERCFGDITLSGDATIIGAGYRLENPLKSPGSFSFNGHRLTLNLTGTTDSFVSIGPWNYAAEGGTLEIASGWFQNRFSNVGGCAQMNLVVRPSVRFKLTDTFETGGLEYESDHWESHNLGTPLVKVYGSYKAGAMRPPLKMQDGSTLDLSAMADVWSADGIAPFVKLQSGSYTTTTPGLVAFEDNASITVDLGARKASGRVVSWTTPPTNLASLKFIAPPGTDYVVLVDGQGISVRRGLFLIVR